MEIDLEGPFGSGPVDEVPLAQAPLVRVLAQVRIPKLVTMSGSDLAPTLDRVIHALAADYPIVTVQREQQITLTPGGIQQTPGQPAWALRSSDSRWQLTLGETYVALMDAAYTNRQDFVDRLAQALTAFTEIVQPPYAERFGVRYVNRIEDQTQLSRLRELVRPEVLGGLAVPLTPDVALAQALSDSIYVVGQRFLRARWGLMPIGAVLDPTVPPTSSPSWVLDLDSFTQEQMPIDEQFATVASELALSAYRYFRWVVTDAFLSTFGGAQS
ncbi:MAG: TIGR04255 family protein [Candidatus Dormiibacterota bacterium]